MSHPVFAERDALRAALEAVRYRVVRRKVASSPGVVTVDLACAGCGAVEGAPCTAACLVGQALKGGAS